MPRHRSHSIEFKRQVAQEFIAGETLHGLAKRHDISRTLIRIWVSKYEAGAFDDDAKAAELLQEQEARIAALERLVGRQALELEFLKTEMRSVRSRRSATTSVITGPPASLSRKDADSHAPASMHRPPTGRTTGRSLARCRRSPTNSRHTAIVG